ncbi:MAG: thiamine-phosphate kinase [Acidobacteriota bacterium]
MSDAGERGLIDRIRRRVPPPPPGLVVGIGDDAAVAAPDRGAFQVLTTDALVEGVHFDRRYSSAFDIGYKALAVNVSDVASMGGTPRFALLSLMLPPELAVADVDALLDGLLELAALTGVALAGGNITRSPGPLVVDVTVTGMVKPRKILTRAGARAGDSVYVTGRLGAAAAGLGWLRANVADGATELVARPDDPDLAECVARHCRPEPRARMGSLLGRNRAASACMDLSDGLADALTQLSCASGTGAAIDAALLPLHPGARAWFSAAGEDPVQACMAGGDDYELLFTVPRRARGRLRAVIREGRGVPVTRIGEVTPDRAVALLRDGIVQALPSGFTHF